MWASTGPPTACGATSSSTPWPSARAGADDDRHAAAQHAERRPRRAIIGGHAPAVLARALARVGDRSGWGRAAGGDAAAALVHVRAGLAAAGPALPRAGLARRLAWAQRCPLGDAVD